MRILFLSNLYPPWFLGGYELLCAEVAEALSLRGHDVSVLTSTHGTIEGRETTESGVSIHRQLELECPFEESYRFSIGRRWRVARENHARAVSAIAGFIPDVIFLWSQLRLTLGPAEAAASSPAPIAWTFNDANLLSYRDAPMSRRLRSRLRHLLCRWVLPGSSVRHLPFENATLISETVREDLLAGGVPVEGAQCIHQGINPDLFPPRPNPGVIGSPMRVCYTGQLHDYKGVHVAAEAVASYAGKHGPGSITLNIHGDGSPEYVRRLEAIAASTEAPIRVLPRIPRERLGAFYREHDVFVFPSTWREPFGLTHLEAMSSGLAVVSTIVGGQREFLRHGENCLVFPPEDSGALCASFERLRGEPDLARSIACAGRELVLRDFTLDGYINRLESFLAGVLDGAKS